MQPIAVVLKYTGLPESLKKTMGNGGFQIDQLADSTLTVGAMDSAVIARVCRENRATGKLPS